jgi:uncharacterized phage protein (TIGR02220 family)
MPLSAQALYFHLSMRADDDGFINNPKKIQRMVGASDDDCKLLIMKRFIITFDSGVIVIKHWKIHNYIRNDRYKPTVYAEEKSLLVEKENKVYTEIENPVPVFGIPNDTQRETQDRIGKDSLEKGEIYRVIVSYLNEKSGTNYRPTAQATQRHINARLSEGYTVDDFKVVIDKKCAEWKGGEMEKYLRPETLFGSKFESYLNAPVTPRKSYGANGVEITNTGSDDLDGIL